MLEIPDALVDRLKARDAALIVGLGGGELAGAPGWPALVAWLAARLPFSDDRAHVNALIAAGRLVDAIVLVRDLLPHGVAGDGVREGYPDGAPVPEAVQRAATLPWRAVVTTGFDDVWPRAVGAARAQEEAPAVVLGTDSAAHLKSFGRRPLLMRLFGHPGEPDSLCLGPGDARTRLVAGGGLAWLAELYRRRSLVLVGFRSRDPDLTWLTAWLSTLPPARHPHFLLLDTSAETDADTEARLLALRTGLTVVPCHGGTTEAIERLANLAEELGPHLPPLAADVDLDAWFARWSSVPNDPEPREVLARAAAGLRNEERWDRLTELLLRRLPFLDDRAQQLADLDEVATIFRDRLQTPDGALRAGLAALRLAPTDDELWDKLRADAAEAGAWSQLLDGATDVALQAGATPEGAQVWHRIARLIRHDLGGKEDALAAYEQALQAQPDQADVRDEQLAFLRELERWEELVAALRAAAGETTAPSRASAMLREAGALLEQRLGDAPAAIAAYERALAIEPATAPVEEALERLYEREQRWADLALSLEKRARGLAPEDAIGVRRHRAALLSEHLNDPDAAAAELEELASDHPEDEINLALLEKVYRKSGRNEDYLNTLRRLADRADDPEIRVARLRTLAAEADLRAEGADWATRAREEILRAVPLDPDAFAGLVREYRMTNRFTALAEMIARRIDTLFVAEAAAEVRGEPVSEAARAEKRGLLASLAAVYEQDLGDQREAYDAYDAAEHAGDHRPEIYEGLVRLARWLERWDFLADSLRRWAAATPDVPRQIDLRLQAAHLLIEMLDDYAGAESELTQVLELAPDNAAALAGLGRLRRQRGAFESASKLLFEAATRETDSRAKGALLADAGSVVQYKLKQEDAALSLYVQALAADPQQVMAGERLAELYARRQQWGELEPILDMLAAHDAVALAPGDQGEPTDLDADDPATLSPSMSAELHLVERAVARHLQRAEVALTLGKPDKALDCFSEAFRLQPQSLTVLKRYAAFRLQRHEWAEAATLYESLRALHRAALSDEEALKITLVVAHCRAESGDITGALTWYQTAREMEPGHRHAVEALARLHAHQKDWAAWVKDRQALMSIATPEEQAALWDEVGDTQREKMGAPADAISSYRAALASEPGRPATLRKLLAVYQQQQMWREAAETLAAVAATESVAQARAGMLYQAALLWKDELDRPAQAEELLEEALDEHPDLPDAFDLLVRLQTDRGDWPALAQTYRRMIARAPASDAERSAPDAEREAESAGTGAARLWNELGEVALRRLGDRELALEAFERAAVLAPAQLRPREQLAELYVQGGADSREKAIAAHHDLLAQDPDRVESYQALVKLYGEAGAFDKRWCVAATLSFLGKADPTVLALFERLRPHQVRLATERMTAELWQRLQHPDEDPLLGALFAAGGALVAAPAAQPLAAHDLKRKEQVDVESDPRPLVRALVQVASTLDVAMPDLYLLDEAGAATNLLNVKGKGGTRPTLVLGPATIRREDPFELAFDTGRLMAFLRPQRFVRHALPAAGALATALNALMMLGGVNIEGADAEAARLAASVRKSLSPATADALTGAAQRLNEARGTAPDLSRWSAGTDLTAARVGLLLCGELGAAARVLWGESPPGDDAGQRRVRDLVAFSISDDYFACRTQLGVAVAA